jgi:hypothetical protein
LADWYQLGALANVAIGGFLALLAVLVWRRSADRPAKGLLAAYLLLVGLNYALDALDVLTIWGWPRWAWDNLAARSLVALDPGVLLLYAIATTRGRVPPVAWLALAPGVALAAVTFAGNREALLVAYTAYVLACYLGAFLLLAARYVRAPAERERLGVLVVAFAPIALPRLGLAYIDLGYVRGAQGRADPGTLLMEAGLLVAFAAFALGCRLLSRKEDWPEVRRTVGAVAGLLLVVELVWMLRFVPLLSSPAFALPYSVRWFLFGAVLVTGLRRQEIFGMPTALAPIVRAVFAGILVLGATAMSAAFLGAVIDASSLDTLLAAALLTGLVLLAIVALRRALPIVPGELAERRARIFRAYALLDAPGEDLEDLRRRLGLGRAEAERLRALARAERAMPPVQPQADPGSLVLGRYEVEGVVGVGAFGRAYAARDRLDGARVVLKELHPGWGADPEALRRFRREAEVVLSIEHPNLVGFRSLEPTREGHVLVLERVDGETLAARLRRGPLAPAEARDLARQVLAGLAALHARGIVHRDLKPANLMLGDDGRVVILDMGAATDGAAATRPAGAHPGSPGYMGPEQARGDPAHPSMDVYALGVVLWEALTGRLPPHGEPPGAWRPLLLRALAPDPRDRFQDADAFLAALP